MNILRWRRKSKKKIKLKTLILFSFSLIMTTFAWFAYSKVLEPDLNFHISTWDMTYQINGEPWDEDNAIEISTLYPAMPEQTVTIDIFNNGERTVDIDYFVQSISIAGVTYTLIQEGNAIPNDVENYIILTQAFTETKSTTDPDTQITTVEKTVKGAITNDINKFPFTIEIEHSAVIYAKDVDINGNDIGGEGYLTIRVNWIGDDHELDSEWGYIVGQYLTENPTATSVISINLAIDSYQIEEELDEIIQMPSTLETAPYLPSGFVRVAGTTLETGLVVKDSFDNEYVWVEVPKNTTVYPNAGLNIDLDSITDETELANTYSTIENDLKLYSAKYRTREEQVQNHYNSIGVAETTYNQLKNKMLKSIYENGGFYIGRYETGIIGSYRQYYSVYTNETPVIQANAYPYNYVSIGQAYSLASSMNSGDYTSSLMFGLQWDLVLKYLENKGAVTQVELATNSSNWGNYYKNTYYVTNQKAKYGIDNNINATWQDITWEVSPYEKMAESGVVITTGANTTFSRQNIFDLAGNLAEWTFNVIYEDSTPIGGNGGSYLDNDLNVVNSCGKFKTSTGSKQVGFRVTIY